MLQYLVHVFSACKLGANLKLKLVVRKVRKWVHILKLEVQEGKEMGAYSSVIALVSIFSCTAVRKSQEPQNF